MSIGPNNFRIFLLLLNPNVLVHQFGDSPGYGEQAFLDRELRKHLLIFSRGDPETRRRGEKPGSPPRPRVSA